MYNLHVFFAVRVNGIRDLLSEPCLESTVHASHACSIIISWTLHHCYYNPIFYIGNYTLCSNDFASCARSLNNSKKCVSHLKPVCVFYAAAAFTGQPTIDLFRTLRLVTYYNVVNILPNCYK